MVSNILVPVIIVTKGNIRILLAVHILILCFSIYCFNIEFLWESGAINFSLLSFSEVLI